jgi:cytidylate kinase
MPLITISRGTLSGGRSVAECLAARLGCRCLAREILVQAAASIGAAEETVREGLQVPPALGVLGRQQRRHYLNAAQAALAEACLQGDLVYHGLAGQLLLRGVPGVLRVRLIAPLDLRVRSLVKAHHRMSARAAERFIRRADRQRQQWVRSMYGVDVCDVALYDLSLNLAALSLETACVAIAELVQHPEYQVSEQTRAELARLASEARRGLAAETSSGQREKWPWP